MAQQPENAKGLSLKDVAKLLEVHPRKVQYLREQGVLVPDVIGIGRGGRCYYSSDDVFTAHILLNVVPFLNVEGKKIVVKNLQMDQNRIEVAPGVVLTLKISSIRRLIQRRYKEECDDAYRSTG